MQNRITLFKKLADKPLLCQSLMRKNFENTKLEGLIKKMDELENFEDRLK